MAKRKSKMERELEVRDSPGLRRARKEWAEAARECRTNVREAAAFLKSEEKTLAGFSDGVRLIDKILARRKRTKRAHTT